MTDTRTTWKYSESRSEPQWLIVIGPYDEAFVADLKRLPAASRRWNSIMKAWSVHRECQPLLDLIIARNSDPMLPADLERGLGGAELLLELVPLMGEGIKAHAFDELEDALSLVGEVSEIRTAIVDGKVVVVAVIEMTS